jgi:hypothetical protein
MKYFVFILVFATSCINNNSTQTLDEAINQEARSDSLNSASDKTGSKNNNTSKVQHTFTQKEIVLNEATVISNEFYNNLIHQNYIGANKHMSKAALSVTSEEQWIEIYKKAQSKKGRLGFVKMWDHGVKIGMKGGNGYGDYAELIFDAQYKDGNFREKLTFFRKDSTQKVQILGYEYDERIERVKIYEELE